MHATCDYLPSQKVNLYGNVKIRPAYENLYVFPLYMLFIWLFFQSLFLGKKDKLLMFIKKLYYCKLLIKISVNIIYSFIILNLTRIFNDLRPFWYISDIYNLKNYSRFRVFLDTRVKKMEILNISLWVGIKATTCLAYSHSLGPCAMTDRYNIYAMKLLTVVSTSLHTHWHSIIIC